VEFNFSLQQNLFDKFLLLQTQHRINHPSMYLSMPENRYRNLLLSVKKEEGKVTTERTSLKIEAY